MKICHVITRFILGGAQENTLASLIGQAVAGHDVTLLTGPSRGREGKLLESFPLFSPPYPFRLIEEPSLVRPLHPLHDIRAYVRLKKHFEKEKYDVIHTHSSKAGILGRRAAHTSRKKHGSKVIHTIHGLAFDEYQPWWRNKVYITAERICAKQSDGIISVCNAMTKQALSAGIGTEKLFTTIYSGCDITAFRSANAYREQKRKELSIPDDTCVIMAITRLFPMKGIEDFMHAIQYISTHTNKKIKAILVGDGPLRNTIEKDAKKTLPPHILYMPGRVPPTDIPFWISVADIVVHGSLREGLARVLVQAIAAGKPVVSYDIGGAHEVIKSTVNGYLCSPGDIPCFTEHTMQLVQDAELRKNIAKNAEMTALDHFTYENMNKEILAYYKRVCNS